MKVTIELPEDVSAALKGRWDDVPRRSLEAIAVEGYRTGALTETQVRRLLQLETRFQYTRCLRSTTCRSSTPKRIWKMISARSARLAS